MTSLLVVDDDMELCPSSPTIVALEKPWTESRFDSQVTLGGIFTAFSRTKESDLCVIPLGKDKVGRKIFVVVISGATVS